MIGVWLGIVLLSVGVFGLVLVAAADGDAVERAPDPQTPDGDATAELPAVVDRLPRRDPDGWRRIPAAYPRHYRPQHLAGGTT